MADRTEFADRYLGRLARLLAELPRREIARCLEVLEDAFKRQAQVLIVGNGGSAATASHLQNDLMLGVAKEGRGGFRARALSDGVATLTAAANDDGFTEVFAQQVAVVGNAGDVLVAISGSGNSPNILRALEEARRLGMTRVGWLGMDGGKAAPLCDVAIIVPSRDYGPIEDVHMVFDHLMTAYLRQWVRGQSSSAI